MGAFALHNLSLHQAMTAIPVPTGEGFICAEPVHDGAPGLQNITLERSGYRSTLGGTNGW